MRRAVNIKQHPNSIDLDEAREHLDHLDIDDSAFTFQTFDDNGERKDRKLARVLHGSLAQHSETLVRLNQAGAGIYITVNQTDGKGRRAENIVRIRSLFVDLDGSPLLPVTECSTPPDLVIETSPNRFHCYWTIDEAIAADLDGFGARQRMLAAKFKGDPVVVDLPRVMRLAGFYHRKGSPFRSRIIGGE